MKRTPVFTAAAILTSYSASARSRRRSPSSMACCSSLCPTATRIVSSASASATAELRRIEQPPAVYFTYKRFARRIDDIGFYRTGNANIWTGDGGDAPERVTATWVTASMIPILQVRPLLGRSFTNDEERLRGPNVVILSESVWRTRFHAALDVIGKKLIRQQRPSSDRRRHAGTVCLPCGRHQAVAPREGRSEQPPRRETSPTRVWRASPRARHPRTHSVSSRRVLPRVAELFPRLESGTATTAWLEQARPSARRSSVARRGHERNRSYALDGGRRGGSRVARRVGECRQSHVDPRRQPAARARGPRGARSKPFAHRDAFPRRIARTHHDGRGRRASRGVAASARWWRSARPTSLVSRS